MHAVDMPKMTADEFLEWVQDQPEGTRYELHGGSVIALHDATTGMVGERAGHADAKTEIARQLANRFRRGAPCRARAEGLAVKFENGSILYPDVMVDCGPYDPSALATTTPALIVEILSPSTRTFDLVVKARRYLEVESLVAIVLVDLDARNAVVLRKTSLDQPEIAPADATLRVELPGDVAEIDLAEVFGGA